jgi:hypothetical protein
MSKGAKFSIIALFILSVKVARTELGFILVRMIKFLDSIVGFVTIISIWTFLVATMSVFNI